MLNSRNLGRATKLAATGFAAGLFLCGGAHAGPFQWLTGKNQQQQQPQEQPQTGNSPGFFPFFGGGRGNRAARGYQSGPDPTAAPLASELPANDPEAYMITNPPLGTPTLSSRNIAATQAAIQRYQAIVAQGGEELLLLGRGRLEPGKIARHFKEWH